VDRSRYFTRGVIILTVLLLVVAVSFFMGKILGNELMESGKERLKPFLASNESKANEETGISSQGGSGSDVAYKGPTDDRFNASWATSNKEGEEGSAAAGTSPVSIEPIEPGQKEDTVGDNGSSGKTSSLFGLDSGDDEKPEEMAFRVQVGVFKLEENAESLAGALRKEQYSAYVQKVEYAGGDIRWKVFVGPFKTLEAANAAAEGLRERSYEAFVR